MKPSDTEKPYRAAVLRNRGGDLKKEWFIEFYACTPSTTIPRRKRIKIPTRYDTDKARKKYAREQIARINSLLAKGYLLTDKNFIEETEIIEERDTNALFPALEVQIKTLQHLRPKSAGTYQSAVNSAKEYFGIDITIEALTSADIYRLRDYFVVKLGNTAVTANKKIGHLGRIYNNVLKRKGIKPALTSLSLPR